MEAQAAPCADETLKCYRCWNTYPLYGANSGFHRNKSRPSGFAPECRNCRREINRKYKVRHRAVIRAAQKRYYDKYAEMHRAKARAYAIECRGVINLKRRIRHASDPLRYAAQRKEYERTHKERRNELRRINRAKNPEHTRMLRRAHYWKNRGLILAQRAVKRAAKRAAEKVSP